MANLYEILGVPHDASTLLIRQRFRRLALQLHPDKLLRKGGVRTKQEMETFFLLKAAAEKLLDVQQRELYDRQLGITQAREAGMISDTYNLFEDFEEVSVKGMETSLKNTVPPVAAEVPCPSIAHAYTGSRSSMEKATIDQKGQKGVAMHVFQMECRCGGTYEVVVIEDQEEREASLSLACPAAPVSKGNSQGSGEGNTIIVEDSTASAALCTVPSSTSKPKEPPAQYVVACDNCSLVIRVIAEK